MAELSTIARPYAEALFAAARDEKAGLAAWAEQVQRLAEVISVEDVRAAMVDPRLEDAQRVSVFLSLVQPAVDKPLQNFVTLLISNDRLVLLPQIVEQFHALKDEAEGVAQADITSAFPMTDEQVSELIKLLEPKFGLKLKPHVTVDATLIGGVRVNVGDQVLDTSVQAQLVRMRDTLAA
ncbi:F0F1 ATP synthase subunit delta [Orrella sp. NBD-18]|uniref:ATP synthase subunit delta n=1 Tax=Sheuella amnicola TaxID=2707330 RepID=A0A6B2R1I8_9BURK|nr:F0F1 ATP synthase subunit delta [Sheuella amnicola]NDY84181.1 F0F1 ATP synthase subunit delta [Sheuella amnicola]